MLYCRYVVTDRYPLRPTSTYVRITRSGSPLAAAKKRIENDAARVRRRKGRIDDDDDNDNNIDVDDNDDDDGGGGECSDRATTPKNKMKKVSHLRHTTLGTSCNLHVARERYVTTHYLHCIASTMDY